MPTQHHHTYKMLDHNGRMRSVEVIHDPAASIAYVATIRGGHYTRMADGSEQQAIIACGIDDTPSVAAECCIQNLLDRLNLAGPRTTIWKRI
jgi:hypothetical protein